MKNYKFKSLTLTLLLALGFMFLDSSSILAMHQDEAELGNNTEAKKTVKRLKDGELEGYLKEPSESERIYRLQLESHSLYQPLSRKTLRSLQGFKNLTSLYLVGRFIEADAFKELKHLRGLRGLSLYDSKNIDLLRIGDLKNLVVLILSGCKDIDPHHYEYIRDLEKLEALELSRCTNITDETLEYLGQLKNLKVLDLRYCSNVTNAGLLHLIALRKLETLRVSTTEKLTKHFVKHLERAIINLRSEYGKKSEEEYPRFKVTYE